MKNIEREDVPTGFIEVRFDEVVAASEERPDSENPAKAACEEEDGSDRDGDQKTTRLKLLGPGPQSVENGGVGGRHSSSDGGGCSP